MDPRQLFEVWAPARWPWSAWVKPALFASSHRVSTSRPAGSDVEGARALERVIPSAARTALVIDLPGARSVNLGVALLEQGYQPVPMFNTQDGERPVIVVEPIIEAIVGLTPIVSSATISAQAPPAFLLDSNRLEEAGRLRPMAYDNRWVLFPQDFPSATLLRSRGITRVILIQEPNRLTGRDLEDVLARWSKGGLEISRTEPNATSAEPFRPRRWWTVRLAFLSLLATMGLRRNAAGGFGSRIPEATSGSGWG